MQSNYTYSDPGFLGEWSFGQTTTQPASNYDLVKEFHEAFGHKAPDTLQPVEDFGMRLKLITEEFKEVIEAYESGKIEDVAKELADLLYVVYGGMIDLGIPGDEVFAEVHWSNMSKLDEDGKPIYREDGKVLKSDQYQEPDIKGVLGLE